MRCDGGHYSSSTQIRKDGRAGAEMKWNEQQKRGERTKRGFVRGRGNSRERRPKQREGGSELN